MCLSLPVIGRDFGLLSDALFLRLRLSLGHCCHLNFVHRDVETLSLRPLGISQHLHPLNGFFAGVTSLGSLLVSHPLPGLSAGLMRVPWTSLLLWGAFGTLLTEVSYTIFPGKNSQEEEKQKNKSRMKLSTTDLIFGLEVKTAHIAFVFVSTQKQS